MVMGVSWLTLFLAFITLLCFYFTHLKKLFKLFSSHKLTGPTALPLFGNALQLTGSQADVFQQMGDWCRAHSGIFRLWIGPQLVAVVYKAELVEPLLKCTVNIQKAYAYNFLKSFVGNGILTSTGDLWHQRRKLLTPSFHLGILENFSFTISKEALRFVNFLKTFSDGQMFNMIPHAKHLSLDIICETAMGTQINSLEKSNSTYVKAVSSMASVIQARTFQGILHFDPIYKLTRYAKLEQEASATIKDFSLKIIKERKNLVLNSESEETAKSGKLRPFLDLLLQSSEVLTESDILDEVNTFIFAGHDTTGIAICWTLFTLGHHPEAQERIIEEIDSVAPSFNETGLQFRDLANLNYLERCIKETMRLFPSVPLVGRYVTNSIETDQGTIPEGATVFMDIFRLHRDESQFVNPDSFDPDRFLDESRHKFAFLPFSAGPRNCIGQKIAMMEVKIVIAHIIKSYVISSVCPMENLKLHVNIVLENVDGIHLRLLKRN